MYPREMGLKGVALAAGALALGLLVVAGCGDDGSPAPVTGVDISPASPVVEVGQTVAITAEVTGGETKALGWYVNGVLGGNAGVGTVSGTGPWTYTAPDLAPDPPAVIVKAVSTENPDVADSCALTVQFTVIHVDASAGNDVTGTGHLASPLKSITAGLWLASAGMTVLVSNGIYDEATGEVFPLVPPDSVSLVGEDWTGTIIRGHSATAAYGATVTIEGRECSLRKFTVEEGQATAHDWQIAIYVDHASDALVDSIRVDERPDYSILRVWYAADTRIENCRFVVDDGERTGHGIEENSNEAGTAIRDCGITGFWLGVALNNTANTLLEGCLIEGNAHGVYACCDWDPDHHPNPDLGGGARGSLGGNVFSDNSECGLSNGTPNAVFAKFNTWGNSPPVEGEDFCNTGTGSVVWQ